MAGRQCYDSEGPLFKNSSPHTYAHGLNLSVPMSLCGLLRLLILLPAGGGASCQIFFYVSRLWVASFLYYCYLKCFGPLELGPVRLTVGLGPAPVGENQGRREREQGTGGVQAPRAGNDTRTLRLKFACMCDDAKQKHLDLHL